MLARRANANCRCAPTTESIGFFCLFFLRCLVRGRPVGAQTPFLFLQQQQCDVTRQRKETLRQSRGGGTLCFYRVTCGQHHVALCLLRVGRSCTHRHGNVQCTEASAACFVDLVDGGHRSQRRHGDPYQPGADGFWFWFWERAVIGGRGGTRRTAGLKHTGPIDGRRR